MGFFTKLFGNKASRDNKALQPILDKTLEAYEKIKTLDIDALRHKTVEFKEYINNYIAEDEARIKELKLKAETEDLDLEKKNDIFEQVDKLEKQQLEKIEEALNTIMPEAFAVLKETAKRFKENEVVEATATAGLLAATPSHGTWFHITYRFSVAQYCTKAKSLRWQPVKARP